MPLAACLMGNYIDFHFSLHYISKGGFPIRHAAKGILFAASLALVTTAFVPASLAKENHNNTYYYDFL